MKRLPIALLLFSCHFSSTLEERAAKECYSYSGSSCDDVYYSEDGTASICSGHNGSFPCWCWGVSGNGASYMTHGGEDGECLLPTYTDTRFDLYTLD
jgi:hypothetical protein